MKIPTDKIAECFEYAKEGLYSAGNKPMGDFEWFLTGIEFAERYFNRNWKEEVVMAMNYPLVPEEVKPKTTDETTELNNILSAVEIANINIFNKLLQTNYMASPKKERLREELSSCIEANNKTIRELKVAIEESKQQ